MSKLKKDCVYERIRADIDNGVLREGEKLLPEREFAKALDVSMSTLRSALKMLEDEGFIQRVRARGTFVAKPYSGFEALSCGRIAYIGRALNSEKQSDWFYNTFFQVVSQEVMRAGYQLICPPCNIGLMQHRLSENGIELLKTNLRQLQNLVDGFIIDERVPDAVLEEFTGSEFKPMVMIGRSSRAKLDCVIPDDKAAAGKLMKLIQKMGYQRIVVCKIERSAADLNRFQCMTEQLAGQEYGVVDGWLQEHPDNFLNKIYNAIKRFEDYKTCIVASNDQVAEFLVQRLQRKGFAVGEHIGVAGYGGAGLKSEISLSTLVTKPEQFGRNAVKTLLKRINDNPQAPAQLVTIEPAIELGETL